MSPEGKVSNLQTCDARAMDARDETRFFRGSRHDGRARRVIYNIIHECERPRFDPKLDGSRQREARARQKTNGVP